MSLLLFTKYNSLSLLEAQQPLDQQPARCLRQTRKMYQRITNWTNCMADSSEEILRLTTRSFTNVVTGAPEMRLQRPNMTRNGRNLTVSEPARWSLSTLLLSVVISSTALMIRLQTSVLIHYHKK